MSSSTSNQSPAPTSAPSDPGLSVSVVPPATADSDSHGFVVRPRQLGVACAVLALVSGVLVATPGGRDQLGLTFTRRPVAFSALAFTDPSVDRMCASVRAGHGVEFTLENHEQRTTTYDYEVVAQPPRGADVVYLGSLTVGAGEAGTQSVPLAGPVARTAAVVDVRLPGRTLHVSLRCPRPTETGR